MEKKYTLSSSLLIFQFKTESSVDADFSISPSSASAFLGRFFTKISVFFSPCVPSWRHSRAYDGPRMELNEQMSHCSSPLLAQLKKKQKKRNKDISCVSILASPADRDEKLCIVFEQLSFLVPVFISCSCHNTLKQTWWLETAEMYSVIVLEGRGVKSRCQHSPPLHPTPPAEALEETMFLVSFCFLVVPGIYGCVTALVQSLLFWASFCSSLYLS